MMPIVVMFLIWMAGVLVSGVFELLAERQTHWRSVLTFKLCSLFAWLGSLLAGAITGAVLAAKGW